MHNRKSFSKVTTASSTAVAVMTVGCGVAFVRWRKAFRPRIIAEPTRFNESILKLCPTLHENYHLPGFLHNGHVETIFAALFRKRPHLMYDRELVHMPDGGVVSLDREKVEPEQELSPNAPIIILLPGLTGGSEDTYVQHAVVHAREAGFRAVVFNPRGCSDSPVTTAQFYSASYTGDLRKVIDHVSAKSQGAPIFAAGWSLGANILCRYLGEQKDDVRLSAAVAMCNPFDLPLADRNFKKGFNRVYDFNLAKSLRRIYSKHHHLFEEASNKNLKSYNPERALYASTIREFDDAITRISFNWPSVDSYYTGSSSALSIPDIKIPLLVVQVGCGVCVILNVTIFLNFGEKYIIFDNSHITI